MIYIYIRRLELSMFQDVGSPKNIYEVAILVQHSTLYRNDPTPRKIDRLLASQTLYIYVIGI